MTDIKLCGIYSQTEIWFNLDICNVSPEDKLLYCISHMTDIKLCGLCKLKFDSIWTCSTLHQRTSEFLQERNCTLHSPSQCRETNTCLGEGRHGSIWTSAALHQRTSEILPERNSTLHSPSQCRHTNTLVLVREGTGSRAVTSQNGSRIVSYERIRIVPS